MRKVLSGGCCGTGTAANLDSSETVTTALPGSKTPTGSKGVIGITWPAFPSVTRTCTPGPVAQADCEQFSLEMHEGSATRTRAQATKAPPLMVMERTRIPACNSSRSPLESGGEGEIPHRAVRCRCLNATCSFLEQALDLHLRLGPESVQGTQPDLSNRLAARPNDQGWCRGIRACLNQGEQGSRLVKKPEVNRRVVALVDSCTGIPENVN